MKGTLITKYDELVSQYKKIVSDKFCKQDFIEYNEILFSAHSCAIEGNSFSVDETRTLKEKGLGMIPQGKTLLEAFEMLDHFQAYEFLLKNLDKPLSEELLKETHRLLKSILYHIGHSMMNTHHVRENTLRWICVQATQFLVTIKN